MKKTLTFTLVLLLIALFAMTGCKVTDDNPLDGAVYTEDTSIGEGDITYTLKVVVGESTVTFTVKTDKTNLAEALVESGIVEGDNEQFGLYIKRVNGILADYNVNGAWWSLSVGGEVSSVGADSITVEDGGCYELTYSK